MSRIEAKFRELTNQVLYCIFLWWLEKKPDNKRPINLGIEKCEDEAKPNRRSKEHVGQVLPPNRLRLGIRGTRSQLLRRRPRAARGEEVDGEADAPTQKGGLVHGTDGREQGLQNGAVL